MRNRLRKIITMISTVALVFSMSLTSYAYTVQQGDTLSKIARENHVTVDQLVEWNQIANRDSLKVGQELKISGGVRRIQQICTF